MQWRNKSKEILLLLILLVAFVLRFYQFNQLPFTWDELSAWNRLHFDHFSDLIEFGIKPDGHPAGVQIFLYYWTYLFGDAEWIIKLPFAIMGLASVFVFYKIGILWWNKTTALLATTFMASLQFFVLYSTIARPYISGLFLTLMMVYFWSRYLFQSHQRKHLFGFIIFAVLSAYNHHFSLLFAAIIGLSGLFVIPKKHLKEYIISGLIIFVLYIPHLPIFFHQLGIGGIGGTGNWLTKPAPDFIWQFLYWAFHYSPWIVGIILSLLGFSFFNRNAKIKNSEKAKKRLLLLIWFSLPIIIGYYYSTLVNPVLQFSMLIFSFPYLLLLIFSWFKELKTPLLSVFIIIILSVNIITLVYNREHFQMIIKQPFEGTAKCLKSQDDIKPLDIFLIYNTIPAYQEYYLKKYHLEECSTFSIYDQNLSLSQFDSLLAHIEQEQILLSKLPETFVSLASHHFPYLIKRTNGYTYESYLMSKKIQSNTALNKKVQSSGSWKDIKPWNIPQARVIGDSSNINYFQFLPNQVWGFNITDSLKNIIPSYGAILDMQADIIADSLPLHFVWACSFNPVEKEDIWRGQAAYQNLVKTDFGYRLYFSIDTRLLLNKDDFDNTIFKSYIWNKEKESFLVKEINISFRESNPIKYGLFSPISY